VSDPEFERYENSAFSWHRVAHVCVGLALIFAVTRWLWSSQS
jgi:hypothetical protein